MKIKKFLWLLLILCTVGVLVCSFSSCEETIQQDETHTDETEPPMEDDKVAKVVVLLGQSNMEGESYKTLMRDKGVSKTKYEEYLRGYPNVQISYCVPWNPAQSSRNCFIPTTIGLGGQDNRFGPEVGIAEYLSNEGYESVFLVKYSYGGTKLSTNWRSPSSGGKTGELYTGAVQYVLNAMSVLEEMGYYPVIEAICWMQGESDSDSSEENANNYYDLQKNFIADLRKDLAYYGNSNGIGFVDAGISDCSLWKYHEIINDAKYRISQEDDLVSYFSTIDNKLEYMSEPSYGADIAHFDCMSEIKLGYLFGENLQRYLDRDN